MMNKKTGLDDKRHKYGHELDYASGWFTVFSKDNFYIHSKCPSDIRKRLEEDWPRVKAETEERHRQGHFSSLDYF